MLFVACSSNLDFATGSESSELWVLDEGVLGGEPRISMRMRGTLREVNEVARAEDLKLAQKLSSHPPNDHNSEDIVLVKSNNVDVCNKPITKRKRTSQCQAIQLRQQERLLRTKSSITTENGQIELLLLRVRRC